jgi:hypothetical protein
VREISRVFARAGGGIFRGLRFQSSSLDIGKKNGSGMAQIWPQGEKTKKKGLLWSEQPFLSLAT